MDRFDLYTSIHKGIRAILFETARTVAATDFSRPEESARASDAIRRLLGFLDEHAAHEDDVILPELAPLAPELFADLRAEHARTDGLQRELAGIATRLAGATERERVSLGRRLAERANGLVAAHLAHLAREESEANRVLWAHFDDGALLALQDRIVAAIAPARLAEWYALVLPAVSAGERRALIGGLLATVSAARFELLTDPARAELGEAAWRDALAPASAMGR